MSLILQKVEIYPTRSSIREDVLPNNESVTVLQDYVKCLFFNIAAAADDNICRQICLMGAFQGTRWLNTYWVYPLMCSWSDSM